MNTLSDLNNSLFELFEDIKTDKIDIKKANALNSTATIIVKNAKTQIDALKLSDKIGLVPGQILPIVERIHPAQKAPAIAIKNTGNDLNRLQEKFAKTLGYENRLAAVVALSSKVFEERYFNQDTF
ncbi:hypothetical protein [Nonlabens sp.]|jgi:hypothetical protein|uniref:hypothetical protein n=1 Tax=Nonlabens sp. TaxID=1888209 RepID=UPI0039E66CD4